MISAAHLESIFMAGERRRCPRRWIEECPTINLAEALKIGAPVTNIRWSRNDDEGIEPYGEGLLFAPEGASVTLRYQGRLQSDGLSHERAFRLETRAHGMYEKRLRLVCPGCSAGRLVLAIHNDQWRCRACHGLGYRSQYISRAETQLLRLRQLSSEIHGGRKPYEHRASYHAKVEEVRRLSQLMKAYPRDPYPTKSRLRNIVETEYYARPAY